MRHFFLRSKKLLHPARIDLLLLRIEEITEVMVGKLYLQFCCRGASRGSFTTGCRANRWRVLNSGGERSGFYRDAAQLPACYLSAVFALGFMVPESEFCFTDVFSNAIAEIRSGEA